MKQEVRVTLTLEVDASLDKEYIKSFIENLFPESELVQIRKLKFKNIKEESAIYGTEIPIDPKEAFIQSLMEKILKRLDGSLTCTFSTCSDAPSYGWSREEYMYMPEVASRLRKQGFTISSKCNFGVTDWKIAR